MSPEKLAIRLISESFFVDSDVFCLCHNMHQHLWNCCFMAHIFKNMFSFCLLFSLSLPTFSPIWFYLLGYNFSLLVAPVLFLFCILYLIFHPFSLPRTCGAQNIQYSFQCHCLTFGLGVILSQNAGVSAQGFVALLFSFLFFFHFVTLIFF